MWQISGKRQVGMVLMVRQGGGYWSISKVGLHSANICDYRRTTPLGYIPSSLMIPPRRFVTLLDQARLHQISQCVYHNAPLTSRHFSLYADHTCDTDLFPRITTAILQVHGDEVWSLEWSHNGKYLASASKDKSVIVWSVGVCVISTFGSLWCLCGAHSLIGILTCPFTYAYKTIRLLLDASHGH